MILLGLIELYAKWFGGGLFLAGVLSMSLGFLIGHRGEATFKRALWGVALAISGLLSMMTGMVVYTWQ